MAQLAGKWNANTAARQRVCLCRLMLCFNRLNEENKPPLFIMSPGHRFSSQAALEHHVLAAGQAKRLMCSCQMQETALRCGLLSGVLTSIPSSSLRSRAAPSLLYPRQPSALPQTPRLVRGDREAAAGCSERR